MPAGRRSIVFGLVVVTLLGLAVPAHADKVSDLKAKAQRIAQQIDQQRERAAQLAEQYNKTKVDLDQATADVATAESKLAEQDGQITKLSSALVDFALKSYEIGDQANGLSALLADDNLAVSVAQRRGYSPLVLGSNQDVADTLKATRQDTDRLRAQLASKQAQKDKLLKTLDTNHALALKATQDLTALQTQTDAALGKAVAEAEAARQAAAAAAARAAAERQAAALRAQQAAAAASARAASAAAASAARRPAAGGSGRQPAAAQDPGPAPPNFPAASPAAAKAVSVALAQRGKPYVFATGGPDTFDCSGLTQYAWAAAGVSMNHWTVSQWNSFPRVPLDALEPGDLVFFGSDVHHMGMYIGGGSMVHAPYTGTVVQVGTIYTRGLLGAVRPG